MFFVLVPVRIIVEHGSDAPTPLKIHHVPVPLTCGVFDGIIVTDPSLLEEDLITTHVTVVSTATGQVTLVVVLLYVENNSDRSYSPNRMDDSPVDFTTSPCIRHKIPTFTLLHVHMFA